MDTDHVAIDPTIEDKGEDIMDNNKDTHHSMKSHNGMKRIARTLYALGVARRGIWQSDAESDWTT